DLDQVEALAPERDALWTRLGKADFLTADEKRTAAGYGPAPGGRLPAGESPGATQKEGGVRGSSTHTGLQAALKFNPAQPRVPAGSGRPSGRWTKPGAGIGIGLPDLTLPGLAAPDGEAPDPGGSDADTDFEDTPHSEPQSDLDSDPQAPSDDDPNLHTVSRRAPRTSLPDATPGQQARFDIAQSRAREATETLRQLDPEWRAPQSFTRPSRDEGVETTIRRTEDLAAAAEARLQELLRDAIPGTNPLWGVNRLREELLKRGFEYRGPARDSPGQLFENPATGEQIRIMERPLRRWGTDPPEKHQFEYYYRYRGSDWPDVGRHTPIPDKPQPK
ncbi:MAG: hypothetical protein KGR19_11010, partial [Acidobacteria bacterium]|nr:hypothetical protein [Acidobacteriota bacterium]